MYAQLQTYVEGLDAMDAVERLRAYLSVRAAVRPRYERERRTWAAFRAEMLQQIAVPAVRP